MRLTLIFVVLIACTAGYGQNVATASLRWNAEEVFNAVTGETTNDAAVLHTYTDRVEWRNGDGTLRYTFSILEKNGSWTNVNNNGTITFEVDKANDRGVITLTRNGGVIIVRIMYLQGSAQEVYELKISSVESL